MVLWNVMKRTLWTIPTAAAILAAAFAVPASAAPTGTKVSRVFQMPCRETQCHTGDDRVISDSGLARGLVQIQVSSASTVGLDGVRLDVRLDDGWTCLREWQTSAETFSSYFNWRTTAWPGGCTDDDGPRAGTLMPNGVYLLRVIAIERVSGDAQTSQPYEVRVNNRPDTPGWANEPTVAGDENRDTHVTLEWYANREPDIVEYHYIRSGPSGDEAEFAVSATSPGGQGCTVDAGVYRCTDDVFPSHEYGGRYEYALIAMRSSPSSSQPCALQPSHGCVESVLGDDVRGVAVVEPAPPKPSIKQSATPKSTPSIRSRRRTRVLGSEYVDPREFFTGTYSKTLPYEQRKVLIPRGNGQGAVVASGAPLSSSTGVDDRRGLLAVAGGLVFLLCAIHIARVARHPVP